MQSDSTIQSRLASGKITISKVDLFRSGAYNNFDIVTMLFRSLHTPPPPKFATTEAKYKLFQAPTESEELFCFCFKRKGKSQYFFCLRKDCKIKHQENHCMMPVAPGDAFVAKDKESAFYLPIIRTNFVED